MDPEKDARSAAGHAAYSMKGIDDRWVMIQVSTFTNWVNEQLKVKDVQIADLQEDFCDGVRLCALLEALQGKRIGRVVKRVLNRHHHLENVTLALRAMQEDNLKLVNIGSEDIVNGNLKLIMGLVWTLILRYQIGKASKVPPKVLMLAWLQAVLPDCRIRNFSTDWNDGLALHALIEYCRPGTCPDWRKLDRRNAEENCRHAMQLAKKHFSIPMIITPENMSSSDLDELSGMTYLSYFMKVDSPGYHATLKYVKQKIPHTTVTNFQTDWNDGHVLTSLVSGCGGHVVNNDVNATDWVGRIEKAMKAAETIGVEPVISAREMADVDVDHLGVMAYAAWFQKHSPGASTNNNSTPNSTPRTPILTPPSPFTNVTEAPPLLNLPPSPPSTPRIPPNQAVAVTQVQKETLPNNLSPFTIELLDDGATPEDVQVEVQGPDSKLPITLTWQGQTGYGHFTPREPGKHQMFVYNEGQLVDGCPQTIVVKAGHAQVKLAEPLPVHAPIAAALPIKINAATARKESVRVEARAPSGRVMEMGVGEANGCYTANFTPTEVGDWQISIFYDNVHIQGSPFHVRVYDAAQVKVFGLEGGAVGQSFSFSADASTAGQGDLTVEIKHGNGIVPARVERTGEGISRISFVPNSPGLYNIKVFFAGVEIEGSPYTLDIVDSSLVRATGEGLSTIEVGKRAVFEVNTHGAYGGDIRVNITGPDGGTVPCNVVNVGEGVYRIEYSPNQVGDYRIEVTYYGKPIMGSPFRASASDWNRIRVLNLPPNGTVGRPVEFEIDASAAGSGNLEIMVNEGTIPCSVQNRGKRLFHASFVAKEPGTHLIQMRFNGKEVPESPWRVDVAGTAHVTSSGTGLQMVSARSLASFEVRTGTTHGDLKATVYTPTQRMVPVQIINQHNGSYRVEYMPSEVGIHTIDVRYNNYGIPGSPFSAKVYDPAAIVISPIPPGIIGKPVEFTIDVNQAGEGQLEIMVNRGSVPNTVKMMKKGVFKVTFVPRDAREHQVDVKFNGELLAVCPVMVPILDASRVTVHGEGIRQVAVNRNSFFRVNTQSAGEADLNVRVTAPSGNPVPANVIGSSAAGYDVDFTAREVGTHRIDVDYGGQATAGSPFYAKVYDPTRVKVEGVEDGIVSQRSSFIVDVSGAGEGNLEISVAGRGRNIQNTVSQLASERFEVSYTPLEAQPHQASVTFNGENVPGSPFGFGVTDASAVSAYGEGLGIVANGKPTSFTINAPGAHARDIEVKVTGPNGAEVPINLSKKDDDNFLVQYTPFLNGDHKVSVAYKGIPITGSPFSPKAWDSSSVKVLNVKPGRVGVPSYFNIDASAAGAGNLEIIVSVAGENVPNFVNSQGKGRFEVSFTPKIADTHMISVKFNNEPAPGQPFKVEIAESGRVHPLGKGMIRVPINEPAVVSIDPRRAGTALADSIVAEIIAPSDKIMYASVSPGDRGKLQAEFIPTEVGPHVIVVTAGQMEIPGSPFACESYDISKVSISQLDHGVVGKQYAIDVDAARAGAGAVDVVVKADNKKVQCKTVEKGSPGLYRATFMPKSTVPHLVFVTFGKASIPGSPFSIDVDDATQVMAKGRCLEACPVNVPAKFEIDASKAPFVAEPIVKILTPFPEKAECEYTKLGNYRKGWTVDWVPRSLGVHIVEVLYGDGHIMGSPFRARTYDLTKVLIIRDDSEPGVDLDGIPGDDIVFYVDASEAGAGNLEIIVRCAKSGQRIANFLEASDRSGKFRIYFTPKKRCHRYKVDVTFNEDQVAGSPFYCALIDGKKATATGEGLKKCARGKVGKFRVETKDVGEAELQVTMLSPTGKDIHTEQIGNPNDGYDVTYMSDEVGAHNLKVEFADIDIQDSPFFPEVYDINLLHVDKVPDGVVGKPILFEVDATMAGKGSLSATVKGRTTEPPASVINKENSLFQVSFTPIEASPHLVMLHFNDDQVPGSPFTSQVCTLDKVKMDWDQAKGVPRGQPVCGVLHPNGVPDSSVEALVMDPFGRVQPAEITNQGGNYRLQFHPEHVGTYQMNVNYAGQPIPGNPFFCSCYDTRKVKVVDITPEGQVGQEMCFVVDTSEAGPGDIDVEVCCQGQLVRTARHPIDNNHHKFTYTPIVGGKHLIDVNFNYEKLENMPIAVEVSDPANSMVLGTSASPNLAVDQQGWSLIHSRGISAEPGKLQAFVTSPNGDLVPAKMVGQPDGDYKVEYSSKYTGRHTVEILYAGQAIMGSPFFVEIYDPNKIRVEGVTNGIVEQSISFDILTHEAGKAELGLTIRAPDGRDVNYQTKPIPLGYRITYIPIQPGAHLIYITYGGLEVPGTPLNQDIADDLGNVTVYGDGLYKGEENKPASFFVKTKPDARGDLWVQVDGPNSIAKCNIEAQGPGIYKVTYVPVEKGTYTIQIKLNGKLVIGCPYRAVIGKSVDSSKVQLLTGGSVPVLDSNGYLILRVNQVKRIEFDTSRAGNGALTAQVVGPNNMAVPTQTHSLGDGKHVLTFMPTQEGAHNVTVAWDGASIPQSPLHGVAQGINAINHEKVVLTGRGLKEAQVRTETEFIIDGRSAGTGIPEVTLKGVKNDIEITCLPVGNNMYRCIYRPQVPGAYLLYIKWSDRLVRGCPFKVNVTSTSDASKVQCTGEGLKMGVMGQEIKSVIDTRQAGPGELTAHCQGPRREAYCSLYNNHDGTFTLTVRPQEAGKHILTIKYDDENVPGSPFALRVSGAPDASQVRVKGPGVEHGILALYQSRFIVETRGAGAGQLTVRVRGPKGAFRVEMQRESNKDRTIMCRYDPSEPGDYVVHVKWSGEHVPGSPFHVHIADTQDELERYLSDPYLSSTSRTMESRDHNMDF